MRKIRNIFIVLVLISAVAAYFYLNYQSSKEVRVKIAETASRDLNQTISYAGSINAAKYVQIGSKIAGRVSAVLFNELDEVQQGQVLIKLEDAEIKAQLRQVQEALNQAKINLVNIEKNLERVEELTKKGFASTEQMDSAQQAYDVGKVVIRQNQANYAFMQAQLEQTSIKAPISGTIVSKHVGIGEIVAGPLGGGSFSAPTPMAEIADLTDLQVQADIDEVDISKVFVGQETIITVDAYPEKTFQGLVREIASVTMSRRDVGITYRIKVHITNPEKILKLGMTANLDLLIENREQILTVPKSAVLVQGDKQFVFKVRNQTVFKGVVETGMEGEEFIEITSGLEPGEDVIVAIKTGSDDDGLIPFGDQGTIPDDILKLEDGQSVIVVN
jgi:HlyD family secretion protein